MKGYTVIIAEAIPGLTQKQYDAIEDVMRHDIYHGTLDWQTREELHRGAIEALGIIAAIAAQSSVPTTCIEHAYGNDDAVSSFQIKVF